MGNVITGVKWLKDGMVNLMSSLGTSRSKSEHAFYMVNLMSDEQLLAAYRSSWTARKIVDIPAFDATRKGRSWKADKAQIEKIEAEELRIGFITKLRAAYVRARLFGGAAILIGTGDLDLMQPLDPKRLPVGGLKYLTVMSKRVLSPGEIVRDPTSEFYDRPGYYVFQQTDRQVLVHPSRLVILTGSELPDINIDGGMGNAGWGWGDSALQSALSAMKAADASAANVADLIYEAKVDVIAIPDFMDGLSDPEYEARIKSRFGAAMLSKGNNGTLLLDKEEEYTQKTGNFTSLTDLMMAFVQLVSGAADIPATRFLGQSPSGMSSTGESDMRNYYDRIASIQNMELSPAIQVLTECIIQSALGSRPPEIHYIWGSLWQMTDKEKADIGKISAETLKMVHETSLYPPEAIANAGATLLMENEIFPSLLDQVEDAGGLPDYEALLEEEKAMETAALEAKAANVNQPTKRATNDAAIDDAEPKTLYVRRDVLNARAIVKHYRDQGVETMDAAGMHVTIIYSKVPVDWFATGDSWSSKMELMAGGARDHALFGPPGAEDALVLMIKSQELEWRHEAFKASGARSSYEQYQPHITLKYATTLLPEGLKPWIGEIKLGPEIFEEVKSEGDAKGGAD